MNRGFNRLWGSNIYTQTDAQVVHGLERASEDMVGNRKYLMIPPRCKRSLWVWKPCIGPKTKAALTISNGREKRQHKNWNQTNVCSLPWERVIKGVLLSTRSNTSVSWFCHARLSVNLALFPGQHSQRLFAVWASSLSHRESYLSKRQERKAGENVISFVLSKPGLSLPSA